MNQDTLDSYRRQYERDKRSIQELRNVLQAINIPGMVDDNGDMWLHILPEGGKQAAINLGQPGPIVCGAIANWVTQKEKALEVASKRRASNDT